MITQFLEIPTAAKESINYKLQGCIQLGIWKIRKQQQIPRKYFCTYGNWHLHIPGTRKRGGKPQLCAY